MSQTITPLLILFLLVSSFSLFLLLEARPLASSPAEEHLITVSRKSGSLPARSGSKSGVGKAPSWSTPATTVPVLIPGSSVPKTSIDASKEHKSGAAKAGFSFFLVSLISIALLF